MTRSVEDKTQDAAASVDTTYTLSVNNSFEGVLADKSDEDWIRVELVEGRSYDIRLHGIGLEAVIDTVLTVYDSDGEEIASHDDIEWEALDRFSMLEFTPEYTGTYYLSASGYPAPREDNRGTYEITVFDEQDDNLDTPLTLSVGERFQGTLDTKFDEDWIRVDLLAGKTYDITLQGIGPDADTDTILRIYNSEGEQVGFHDDVDFASGRVNSRLAFSPEATGAYYLGVSADRDSPTQDNSGLYQVALHDVDAEPLRLVGTEENDFFPPHRLTGGSGNDELDGKGGGDWLEGGAGADTLIGGGSNWDMASYQFSDTGVEVRLDDGTARGGHAEGDIFTGMTTYRQVQVEARESYSSEVSDVENLYVFYYIEGIGDAEAEEFEIFDIEDLFGSAHDDILVGTYGPNWLFGHYGNDRLDGGEGNDRLFGGGGADALIGGDGIDTASYFYSNEGVEVSLHDGVGRGGPAEGDTFPGRQTILYQNPAGDTVEIEVSDIENLDGSYKHNDILIGSQGSNRLRGYDGDDELDGRGGHDLLEGRQGADVLWGGEGNDLASYAHSDEAVEVRLHNGTARGGDAEGDTFPGMKTVEYMNPSGDSLEIEVPDVEDLVGSPFDDILVGAHGPNRLGGFLGDDELDGREGDDWLDGGPGADMLRGGAGNDTASYVFSAVTTGQGVVVRLYDRFARGGEAEGDTFATEVIEYTVSEGVTLAWEVPDIENLHGSTLADVLAGDLRDNRIDGDAGDDELHGGPGSGDDLLAGGTGDDRLYGGKGNDILQGGAGNDLLWGGPGDDMLEGGEGDDAFIIAARRGNDTILDFGNGEDRIYLTAFAEIQSVEDLDIQQQETSVVIDLSAEGGGTVTLQDFDMTDLTDAHFGFLIG